MADVNSVAPKAAAKHELLFNKLAFGFYNEEVKSSSQNQ